MKQNEVILKNISIVSFHQPDGAGTNKQHVITKNTAKLDRETEELKHDKIPLEVGKIIQEGRKAKGLKQSELAAVSVYISFSPLCFHSILSSLFSLKRIFIEILLFCFFCSLYPENLRETTNYNRLRSRSWHPEQRYFGQNRTSDWVKIAWKRSRPEVVASWAKEVRHWEAYSFH